MTEQKTVKDMSYHTNDIQPEHTSFFRTQYLFISILLFVLYSPSLRAQEPHEKRPDLTFSHFFSDGWKFTQWEEPEQEPDQAPRFRLLKIPATVFEREVRMNYSFTNNGDGGKFDKHEWEFEFEIPISRRLLLEVEPRIVSLSSNSSNKNSGFGPDTIMLDLPPDKALLLPSSSVSGTNSGFGDLSLIARIMLVETRNTTLLSLFEISLPTGDEDRGLGSGLTTVSPGIGFWRDLGKRYALHSFFGLDIPTGGKDDEDPDTTIVYGTAITKTVTPKDTPFFGNLTLFVEFNGSSDIGSDNDTTVVSILPGVRWHLWGEFWLMPGIEFPVIGRDEFDSRVWFSVLKDF
ncbi:MAG: transporter [wastewater metagenome]|nr:transporter [Candidatus Loosdrechtia aerotolerans]